MINDDLPRNQIQAMVVVAGGKFPYLGDIKALESEEGTIDLGIEFTG
jgi:hypothetical protein